MSIVTWDNTAEYLRSVLLDSSHHSNVEAADQQQQQQVQEAGGRDAVNGNSTMEQTNNQGTLSGAVIATDSVLKQSNGNGQVYPPTHIWEANMLPQEEHQGRAQEHQGTLNPPYPAAALAQLLDCTMPEVSHVKKCKFLFVLGYFHESLSRRGFPARGGGLHHQQGTTDSNPEQDRSDEQAAYPNSVAATAQAAGRSNTRNKRQYVKMNDLDVLSGRGTHCRTHPAHQRYLDLVRSRITEFSNSDKHRRKEIVNEIIEEIDRCGGRFLKRDESGWYIDTIGQKKKFEIVQQALRTRKKKERAESERDYTSQAADNRLARLLPAILTHWASGSRTDNV
eukprot:scaffold5114_cov67-Cylindrotheca_fusiformis.AAC.11